MFRISESERESGTYSLQIATRRIIPWDPAANLRRRSSGVSRRVHRCEFLSVAVVRVALSRNRESHRNSIAVDRIERISLSLSFSLSLSLRQDANIASYRSN